MCCMNWFSGGFPVTERESDSIYMGMAEGGLNSRAGIIRGDVAPLRQFEGHIEASITDST